MDAESEQRIERAMRVLFSGRTSIIVAHRLSTVRDADEILVIDDGRVVERGRHPELMAAEGRYWQLYEQWERTCGTRPRTSSSRSRPRRRSCCERLRGRSRPRNDLTASADPPRRGRGVLRSG